VKITEGQLQRATLPGLERLAKWLRVDVSDKPTWLLSEWRGVLATRLRWALLADALRKPVLAAERRSLAPCRGETRKAAAVEAAEARQGKAAQGHARGNRGANRVR
jgi:hypothetical protein